MGISPQSKQDIKDSIYVIGCVALISFIIAFAISWRG